MGFSLTKADHASIFHRSVGLAAGPIFATVPANFKIVLLPLGRDPAGCPTDLAGRTKSDLSCTDTKPSRSIVDQTGEQHRQAVYDMTTSESQHTNNRHHVQLNAS